MKLSMGSAERAEEEEKLSHSSEESGPPSATPWRRWLVVTSCHISSMSAGISLTEKPRLRRARIIASLSNSASGYCLFPEALSFDRIGLCPPMRYHSRRLALP